MDAKQPPLLTWLWHLLRMLLEKLLSSSPGAMAWRWAERAAGHQATLQQQQQQVRGLWGEANPFRV